MVGIRARRRSSNAPFRTDARVKTRVLRSLEEGSGQRCVDIFVRLDGTFGFEEYRRDHEDGRGWFPVQTYSVQVFKTEAQALSEAQRSVAWLAEA
jgi:hypothetical protein